MPADSVSTVHRVEVVGLGSFRRFALPAFIGLFAALPGRAQAPDGSSQDAPLPPDLIALAAHDVVHSDRGPRIFVAPGDRDRVTLRLSVPLGPELDHRAAAPLLLRLAEARTRGIADAVGAQFEFGASVHALAYTVTGATRDLDQLAYLLRLASRDPGLAEGLPAARAREAALQTRLAETGEGRLEASLLSLGAPDAPTLERVRDRIRTFSQADLRRVWRETHPPRVMTVLVVGDVETPPLLAALEGLGAETSAPPIAPGPVSPPPAPTQGDLLRSWYGVAWRVEPALDPRTAVLAALTSRWLRDRADAFEAHVRVWEGRDSDVVAVLGSAFDRGSRSMRGALDGWARAVADDASDGDVLETSQRLGLQLRLQSRTPAGRAHLIGRFIDAGGSPDAAARYVARLEAVHLSDLRAFVSSVAATAPDVARVGR